MMGRHASRLRRYVPRHCGCGCGCRVVSRDGRQFFLTTGLNGQPTHVAKTLAPPRPLRPVTVTITPDVEAFVRGMKRAARVYADAAAGRSPLAVYR